MTEVLVTYQVSYETQEHRGIRFTDQFQFIDEAPEFPTTAAYAATFADVYVYDIRIKHDEVPTPVGVNHPGACAIH